MPPRIFLIPWICLLAFSTGTARADDAQVRFILCPRSVAESLKTNLDSGELADDSFQATYERMAASRQIIELLRYSQAELKPVERIKARSPVGTGGLPSNGWESTLALDLNSRGTACDFRWLKNTTPPPNQRPTPYGTLTSDFTASIPFNAWQVIDETSFGDKVALSLLRVTKADAPKPGPQVRMLMVQGYLIQMSASEAAAIAAKSSEEITGILPGIRNSSSPGSSFRLRGKPGQKAVHHKGDLENPFYQSTYLTETESTRVELDLVISRDYKLIDCSGTASLVKSLRNDKPAPRFNFTLGQTFSPGEWKAVAADIAERRNESAVILIHVTDSGDPQAPPLPLPSQKPLNDLNSNAQSYSYAVQPGAMRTLQSLAPGQPLKEGILKAGLPEGDWMVFWKPLESSFELVADIATHKKFGQLLEDKSLLWQPDTQ